MGVLGKIFGKRRNKIINEEIVNAYIFSPGKVVTTNIYFDAADAFAKDNNLKEKFGYDSNYYEFTMIIERQSIFVTLSRSSTYGTIMINARPAN